MIRLSTLSANALDTLTWICPISTESDDSATKSVSQGKQLQKRINPRLSLSTRFKTLNETVSSSSSFLSRVKIVFAGDIFQSIQKEPRESLLWSLLNTIDTNVGKHHMNITPRIPKPILSSLQKTLSEYYPEFSPGIAKWKSDNEISQHKVKWHRLYTYSHMFTETQSKIDQYGAENTMVLTFSSAITVRGSLGDVARFRSQLGKKGIDMNKNHKQMEDGKLFLSTANSSKGLERDHVVIFLTFPLELAFSNFSDDIIVNLITVGVTRARKTVDFYVPAYKDKFTRVLNFFDGCPKPDKEGIRKNNLSDMKFQDYMDMDHCVTEIIKQSVLIYDTRVDIKSNCKQYMTEKCFEGEVRTKRPIMLCEEERALVGLIIENLMTSTLVHKVAQDKQSR